MGLILDPTCGEDITQGEIRFAPILMTVDSNGEASGVLPIDSYGCYQPFTFQTALGLEPNDFFDQPIEIDPGLGQVPILLGEFMTPVVSDDGRVFGVEIIGEDRELLPDAGFYFYQ